ncbi:MAG: sigma-54-dependent Fis family transcriptional regulator [Deltaproteobacteria bacterium]|nr:sigma-54-dependent Fis family transcriptional regulator [Deltaproteobacteria bacterium]MBI4374400.1 sigma-54-dependent Fis family transcriptional regulator [Deltaproteobacteria bacterium]
MKLHLLLVDDDPSFCEFVRIGLQKDYRLTISHDLVGLFAALEKARFDLLLLDVGLGEENGIESLRKIKHQQPDLDVVMVSGYKEPKKIVEAIKSGASDYLTKPFEIEELIAVIEKIRPVQVLKERHAALVEGMNEGFKTIIGKSPSFLSVLETARKVKGKQVPIFIEGASGTGKELLAKQIHRQENNPKRPFIALNCAAIPENLLESELFGHERGSFTGASDRKIGKFELAHGGDIFLDEISCLKLDLQAKLLRVLQEREVTRLGGEKPMRLDFRVIAATNENLGKLAGEGKFREDLFHRLRVITLRLPTLQERAEDIPCLIDYFLEKHDPDGQRTLSADAIDILEAYSWPGNIRELENLIQSLVILVPDNPINREDLPEWIIKKNRVKDSVAKPDLDNIVSLKSYVDGAEKAYVERTLEVAQGDKTKAASLLGIGRSSLHERLKNWRAKTDEGDV